MEVMLKMNNDDIAKFMYNGFKVNEEATWKHMMDVDVLNCINQRNLSVAAASVGWMDWSKLGGLQHVMYVQDILFEQPNDMVNSLILKADRSGNKFVFIHEYGGDIDDLYMFYSGSRKVFTDTMRKNGVHREDKQTRKLLSYTSKEDVFLHYLESNNDYIIRAYTEGQDCDLIYKEIRNIYLNKKPGEMFTSDEKHLIDWFSVNVESDQLDQLNVTRNMVLTYIERFTLPSQE